MSEDERDREWLTAWCDGDQRGGDLLTQAYFEPVRRYFFRRAPDEYEDLIQRTFLGLAKSKEGFRGEGTLRAFLFAIARHVYLKYLGAVSRREKIEPFRSSAFEILGRRPSSLIAAQQEHQALLQLLEEIPVNMQDMLELYYWEDMSVPELREILGLAGMSDSAVHGQLHRARKQLREKLVERGIERTDAEVGAMLSETRALNCGSGDRAP